MAELVLHHYWGSPYAEKIRALFGYKGIPWRSREISVTPPRPSLSPILGAFRRTPVLQLGADYICDTRLIVDAIDDMEPRRSLAATANRTVSDLICGWAEPRVFALLGPVRFQTEDDVTGIFDGTVSAALFSADRLPFMRPVYEADRYFDLGGSSRDHVRHYLQLLESFFSSGAEFVGGSAPTHGDFSAYHTTWWLRVAPAREDLLAPFPLVARWADRMAAFGHGTHRPISDEETLYLAADQAGAARHWRPTWPERADDRLGKTVEIMPDDYGRSAVAGVVVAMTDRHLTIERVAAGIGVVRIHFPRHGYEVVQRSG